MKKVDYAYDVLHYETYETTDYCYAIRIKKYRLKSRYPLIVGSVTRTPVINDFSALPDDYDKMCVTVEVRFRYNMDLADMKLSARRMLRDRFLQSSLDLAQQL